MEPKERFTPEAAAETQKSEQSWGVLPEQAEHSNAWDCLKCGWRWPSEVKETTSHIVGFSSESPFVDSLGSKKIGKLIVECPVCFSKFWVHINQDFLNPVKKDCENWPKGEK